MLKLLIVLLVFSIPIFIVMTWITMMGKKYLKNDIETNENVNENGLPIFLLVILNCLPISLFSLMAVYFISLPIFGMVYFNNKFAKNTKMFLVLNSIFLFTNSLLIGILWKSATSNFSGPDLGIPELFSIGVAFFIIVSTIFFVLNKKVVNSFEKSFSKKSKEYVQEASKKYDDRFLYRSDKFEKKESQNEEGES